MEEDICPYCKSAFINEVESWRENEGFREIKITVYKCSDCENEFDEKEVV